MIPQLIDLGILLFTVTMMLAIGLELRIEGFRHILSHKRTLFLPLLLLLILPPFVGLLTVRLLPLSPVVASGLILIAACPIGDIANLYTLISRGNPALSISLHSITCLIAPLSMAIILPILAYFARSEDHFALPGSDLLVRLSLYIFLPTALGILWRRCHPPAARFSNSLQNFSGLLVLAVMILVVVMRWDQLMDTGMESALVSLFYIIACLTLGALCLRALRLPPDLHKVIILCFPVRNLGIAAAISAGLMGRIDLIAVCVAYFVVEIPLLLPLSFWIGRRHQT